MHAADMKRWLRANASASCARKPMKEIFALVSPYRVETAREPLFLAWHKSCDRRSSSLLHSWRRRYLGISSHSLYRDLQAER